MKMVGSGKPSKATDNSTQDNTKDLELTIGVFFDGTLNNMDNVEFEKKCRSEKKKQFEILFEYSPSFSKGVSNIARLFKCFSVKKSNTFKIYIEGVGTSPDVLTEGNLGSKEIRLSDDTFVASTLGIGDMGLNSKIANCCKVILSIIQNQMKEDEVKYNVTLKLYVYGFSRGAASARRFVSCIKKTNEEAMSQIVNFKEIKTGKIIEDIIKSSFYDNLELKSTYSDSEVISDMLGDDVPDLELDSNEKSVRHAVVKKGLEKGLEKGWDFLVGNFLDASVAAVCEQFGVHGVYEALGQANKGVIKDVINAVTKSATSPIKAYKLLESLYYKEKRYKVCLNELIENDDSVKDSLNNLTINVEYLGLFDTVSSYGVSFTDDVGELKLSLKGVDIKRTYHICAADEYRLDYALTEVKSANASECVIIPGSHCDIGGGYNFLEREEYVLTGMLKSTSEYGNLNKNILKNEGWFSENNIKNKGRDVLNLYSIIPFGMMVKDSGEDLYDNLIFAEYRYKGNFPQKMKIDGEYYYKDDLFKEMYDKLFNGTQFYKLKEKNEILYIEKQKALTEDPILIRHIRNVYLHLSANKRHSFESLHGNMAGKNNFRIVIDDRKETPLDNKFIIRFVDAIYDEVALLDDVAEDLENKKKQFIEDGAQVLLDIKDGVETHLDNKAREMSNSQSRIE